MFTCSNNCDCFCVCVCVCVCVLMSTYSYSNAYSRLPESIYKAWDVNKFNK